MDAEYKLSAKIPPCASLDRDDKTFGAVNRKERSGWQKSSGGGMPSPYGVARRFFIWVVLGLDKRGLYHYNKEDTYITEESL